MAIPKKPRIDAWYKDDEERSFKIVAIDDEDGTIEIQYFDGDIAEVDTESWYQLDISAIAEPEDGSGPFDDFEQDEFGASFRATQADDWDSPVDEIDFE